MTTEDTNREYDKTQLRETSHGSMLHRDYSAHFFRYSFVRRFVNKTMSVLDIGCGQDRAISKILNGVENHFDSYVGVDLNKLKPTKNKRLTLYPEFNFVERYRELVEAYPNKFDVVISLESIEHMLKEHGQILLEGAYSLTKPGGTFLISTPCYDGVRMAKNHIHEYTIPELRESIEAAGFQIERRFGTFMDIKHIGKEMPDCRDPVIKEAIRLLRPKLTEYYDNDAISCIFAPLYPDKARNNVWVCRRP